MEHQHDLIVKYLSLISEQEKIINTLNQSNKTLQTRNTELRSQKRIYKDSALEWKSKHDAIKSCLSDTYKVLLSDSNINKGMQEAIDIYKQNQGGN
ncbi:hypothetical protein [Sulfurimonas sp.]|uniref:hypothetical protein n=1 Tax=Sulfurimonas sp. TaxID=2022749 RepID=UPI0035684CA9